MPRGVYERNARPTPPFVPGEPPDTIILSVRLRSGGFESQIEVPVYSERAEIDRLVSAWLALMDAGLKVGQQRSNPQLSALPPLQKTRRQHER